MKQLTNIIGKYPLGIWITLIALGFTIIAWLMQAYSLLDWEGAIALGIQGESFNGGVVEQALATYLLLEDEDIERILLRHQK